MLFHALGAARDLGRLHEIASVLIRFGFGDVVRRMGMASALERAGRVLMWKHAEEFAHMETPVRIRHALEELGPTFIKLGQVLSSRVDMFSKEWIDEFGKLQDSAPPAPYDLILAQFTEDMGSPPEKIFASFDPAPIAAASIAQVHRATTMAGNEVVVKIRRPGIQPVIEADLRLLMRLAEFAEANVTDWRNFHPVDVVREFSVSITRELDFTAECRNGERIARNFQDYRDKFNVSGSTVTQTPPPILIPKIHWEWLGERICVQDYIQGIPGRDLAAVEAAGLDRKLLASRGANAVLKMIILDGDFHADPHPGNLLYLPGNRIAFLDFGMVGRLSEERRNQISDMLIGLVRHEPSRVAEVLLDWSGDSNVDEAALERDILFYLDQYYGLPLKQIRLGHVLNDLATTLRMHRIILPPDLALLVKAFITLEGMGTELDPDFDMASEALPMLEEVYRRRYYPGALMQRGWRSAAEYLKLLADLPYDASRLLRAARRGRMEIHVDVSSLKHVGNQLDGAANRLTIGIVVAAMIVGSSIVMTVGGGPELMGLPLFGLLGYLGAAIGGIWLLYSILKSNWADKE